MKRYLFLATIAAGAAFTSCQKFGSGDPGGFVPSCGVASSQSFYPGDPVGDNERTNDGAIEYYNYNERGELRIIDSLRMIDDPELGIIADPDDRGRKTEFRFSPTAITVINGSEDVNMDTYTYNLDELGRIKSVDMAGEEVEYQYDSSGYLQRVNIRSPFSGRIRIMDLNYSGGNLTYVINKLRTMDKDGNPIVKEKYEGTDANNKPIVYFTHIEPLDSAYTSFVYNQGDVAPDLGGKENPLGLSRNFADPISGNQELLPLNDIRVPSILLGHLGRQTGSKLQGYNYVNEERNPEAKVTGISYRTNTKGRVVSMHETGFETKEQRFTNNCN